MDRQNFFVARYGPVATWGVAALKFDGELRSARFRTGGPLRLKDVLGLVAGLRPHESDGPAELLNLEVPGDWVYRDGTPKSSVLKALAAILRDELKQAVRFEPREAEQDVLVVRGRWQPPADPA